MFTGTLTARNLTAALESEIARTHQGLEDGFAPFDPVETPKAWHRILQG